MTDDVTKTGEIIASPVVVNEPTEQDNDYKYARENFYNVIEKGTQALEDVIDLARASEHPRAYEVLATLMKTLTDTNKDLVKMGQDRVERQEKQDQQNSEGGTNNNIFVGSTSELQAMLKDLKQNDTT